MVVELAYFKDTGKYYTDGGFPTDSCSFHAIVERVVAMHREGRLPGLVRGAGKDMFVLIQPPDGEGAHGVPHLLRPVNQSSVGGG